MPANALDVYVTGGYAYLADASEGFRIIDVSDPTNPTEVGFYDVFIHTNYTVDVYVVGQYAYLANDLGGPFTIIDVAEPTSPKYVGSYSGPGGTRGVHVVGNRAYLAHVGNKMSLFS